MARPVFPHELTDPDFQWLLSTFRETRPYHALVEVSCMPIVLIFCPEAATVVNPNPIDPSLAVPVPANVDDMGDDFAEEQDT